MPFTITTLVENASLSDTLAAEHGLSIFIEGDDLRLLYDTGPSPRFLLNAKQLGIGLDHLDAIILSHGHYDHTGGTSTILAQKDKPKTIYVGSGFFKKRFSKKESGLMETSATIDNDMISQFGVPCMEVNGAQPLALGNHTWLLSGFTSVDPLETANPKAVYCKDNHWETDTFEDEIVLALDTADGLTLISGCSHIGIISICRRAEMLLGKTVIRFIGGTHLMVSNEERIIHTCNTLREMGLTHLGACHCNGEQASSYFRDNFPGYFENHTGTKLFLE